MNSKIFTLAVIAAFVVFGISAAFADSDSANGPVKAAYQKAHENFQKAKVNYDNAKSEWNTAKKAYLSAVNKTNKTNETALAVEKGKAFLNRTVSRMLSHLDLLKSKVADMKVLSDSEKANITADFDASISALTSLQSEIPGVTTTAQLKNLSEKIKAEWNNARKGIARAVGLAEEERYQNAIAKAENASLKAEKVVNALKNRGADTAAVDALVSEYNSKVALAKASFASAKEKFLAGDNEGAKAALKAGRDYLKEAQELLKDAAKKVKEGMKEKIQAQRAQAKEQRKNVTR